MERKRSEDGKKAKRQRQDVGALRGAVSDFLLSSQANSLQSNATEANLAFEAGCELVAASPLDADAWLLVVQVVSSCKGRFELRVTKQVEASIPQAVGQVFASSTHTVDPARSRAVEQCWEALQTEVGFCLSLDSLFSLMTTRTLLSTPTFVLKALLQACQNFGSPRKLFESVVNHAELLRLLISLACTNTVAWDVLYACLFEHDAEDDLAKACPRVATSPGPKKGTNQLNWKQVFWPKLFASRSANHGNDQAWDWPRGWGTVLCKMHRKRHGEAAAFTTQIWFELLFHSASALDLGELASLLDHGPLFYSPTSETDVAALGQLTAEYVTKGQLDLAVIQRLLVVDHRCVEPHFALLLDSFPRGMELALCLAEAFAKTRRLPAWVKLMASREFAFAGLAEQTEFRDCFAKLLRQHLLEHQTLQAWRAFLDHELNQVLLCAFEAFILVLPCQLDQLPMLDQAVAKCPLSSLPSRDVCSAHSLVRLHATCRKFREILCVAGEAVPPDAVELPIALREYMQSTANARPSREFLALQTSKELCIDTWGKIARGELAHLLDLAWFFELPKMRHYFVKFFTRAAAEEAASLDLVLRFPVGYLSPKQLGKVVLHALDTAKPDTIAKVLLRPRSAPVTSQLFPTCQGFVEFVCQLESPKDAEDLIQRFPLDADSLPVLLAASPSYLHAATLVQWEPEWVERFLAEHCAKADTLWMLASCLNVAKQQSKSAALRLDVGLGLKLALGKLHSRDAQAFVRSLSETFYLFSDAELVQRLAPLLFAFCLELLRHQSALGEGEGALERTLEHASTQQVAQLIDALQAYAWSVDPSKQHMASQAFRVLFEFGVRGNYETIVKRRTRSLLVALARLAQTTDGDEAWRALCAFASSGGNERLDISSRDIVVVLTATQACRHAGKMRFFQILLESFPACITGDASAAFVSALCSFEAVVVTAAPVAAPAAALGEFSKVCEKLQGLEKTLRHHAVAMLCNHVDLVLGLRAAGAEDRKYERLGFYLLDLCGEYELNQLNAVLGSGADEKLAAERRRFVKSLTDSHAKNHVFRGKI